MMNWQNRPVLVAVLIFFNACVQATAQRDNVWINPGGGVWREAANWSVGYVPVNGDPNPGDTYRAIIGREFAPLSVDYVTPSGELDEIVLARGVTLTQLGGTLEVGRILVGAGQFEVTNNGRLTDSSIVTFENGLVTLSDGRIHRSTIAGNFDIVEPSLLWDVQMNDATVTLREDLEIRGEIGGDGQLVIAPGADVRLSAPIASTIGSGAELRVPSSAELTIRPATENMLLRGRLSVDGLARGLRFENHGVVDVGRGGNFWPGNVRQSDSVEPAVWRVESGGAIGGVGTLELGSEHRVEAILTGDTNGFMVVPRRLKRAGTLEVVVDPTYMPRPDRDIRIWTAPSVEGEFNDTVIGELPRGFSWDTSRFDESGVLRIEGPAARRIAHTDFLEPAIDTISYSPRPGATEIGYQTDYEFSDGNFPYAGVTPLGDGKVLQFQSVNSLTTFETVDVSTYSNASIDLEFSLAQTAYELDVVEITAFTDDPREAPVTWLESIFLGEVPPDYLRTLSLDIPSHWTSATLQVRTSTNSSSGAEQIRIHSVEYLGYSFKTRGELVGDFDVDTTLDIHDLEKLTAVSKLEGLARDYDLNDDRRVDQDDRLVWIEQLWGSYVGDSNEDGQFSSADLVQVFSKGEYEDDLAGNSYWQTGDWSGDGEFSSQDLVLAFQRGGYENGPRPPAPVPEPLFSPLVWLVLLSIKKEGRNRT